MTSTLSTLSIHNIKEIKVSEITKENCEGRTFYFRFIRLIDDKGSVIELNLFSDHNDSLNLKLDVK